MTKGWLLEILWNEVHHHLETLSAMRDMNMPKCASMQLNMAGRRTCIQILGQACYEEGNSLQVYKRKRMNKSSMASKYPTQSASSRSRREKNGNSLADAIAKEMKNVMVAFEVKNPGEKPPDGWGDTSP
jgi:hypothetical protein